ncbi:GNAT family N-acetyltransferase [Bdellovibrio sp. HCB337]|uniref:GNAT family N-acetyltransferase n=1 Tax=Bdellovibrio sp. HCB337 TaxID=3394358 RepID=UPI0039A448F9
MSLRIEKLTEKNFADYEKLTSCESGGGCYCAFWHQKIASMQEWDQRKKENPQLNRQTILDKVLTGFHVGVLAYRGDELIAWISVGPIIDTYWFWRRAIQLGEPAKNIAGITCITIAKEHRSKGIQAELLTSLSEYGKTQGWTRIEGYPFEESTYKQHGRDISWPGNAKGFENAGFQHNGAHWLSQPGWDRAVFGKDLS